VDTINLLSQTGKRTAFHVEIQATLSDIWKIFDLHCTVTGFLSVLCCVETVPHYAAQAGLKLQIFLPQTCYYWDYRNVPPLWLGFLC
jgi:hypothetical protein